MFILSPIKPEFTPINEIEDEYEDEDEVEDRCKDSIKKIISSSQKDDIL